MMLQSGATAREGSPALAMPMRGMAGRPAQAFAPPAFPGPGGSERSHDKLTSTSADGEMTLLGFGDTRAKGMMSSLAEKPSYLKIQGNHMLAGGQLRYCPFWGLAH